MRAKGWTIAGWAAFCAVNVALMWLAPGVETVPFHLVWVSLAIVYGLQAWPLRWAVGVCLAVTVLTGLPLLKHVRGGLVALEELSEIPLMPLLFLVMVWHVRRRSAAVHEARRSAEREQVAHRMQERFVRLASHELRTPITVARGYTELLREELPDPRVIDDTDVVLDELGKLERIAGGLHAVAWAHRTGATDAQVVDLAGLVQRVVRRWTPVAGRTARAEVSATAALGDEDRLETALDCLVENVLRHTTDGTSVVLRARQDGPWAIIEVEDDGPGISEDLLTELADEVSPVKSQRGAGLGLTIVRGVVDAHGGRLALEHAASGGLRVTVRLPASSRVATAVEPTCTLLTP